MKKTICLNMIVKNESHIIESTLQNILDHLPIDYWIISDTGSTDDTREIITNFFKGKDIPGELFQDEWRDFGYNRTKALEHTFNKTDYVFIFDADDLIHGDFILPIQMDKDKYNIPFEKPTFYYRPILVSNRMKWKYNGVLHEYIVNVDPILSEEHLYGNYYIESRRIGSRSKNPDKYLNDAMVLEKGFFDENDDIGLKNRYAYYCAQSYQDAGKYEKAIKWFEKTLTLDYSPQYKYCACIRAGNCYNELKQFDKSIIMWGKSYEYDNERLEGIVKTMEYYYNKGIHFMVSSLYNKFKHISLDNIIETNKIFLDHSKYIEMHYYASISGCYCNERKSAYDACKYLLLNNWKFIENTISNLQFYIPQFKQDSDKKPLVDFFIHYINNGSRTIAERENAWKIIKDIMKEEYPDKYDLLEKTINKKSINEKTIDKSIKYVSSNKILVYTGWMTHLWNESHLDKKALGGSEKAVAYLTRELPKNYEIIVSGDVEEGIFDNVTYIHQNKLQSLLDETEFHTIIVSRNISFFEKFKNSKCFQLILSLHDTYILNNGNNPNSLLDMYNDNIDKFITLTPWHKSNTITVYPSINPDKIKIINNGIDVSQFNDNNSNNKIKNNFIWSSRSERGLHIMLDLWREIIDKLPDATLDICSYGDFPKDNADNKMMEIINNFDSITHHGKLNTNELYDLMAKSEYWLYTNTFPETSCITAMEMLMSEVICLYYPLAGLLDTIGDYGLPVKQGEEIETLVNLTTEKKVLMREKGKEYALSCSWKNRAVEWSTMLGMNNNNNRIGIFNSFPFHYEMFGFILNYAQNNNIEVDIFTNQNNNLGWMDFYKEKFNNFNIIDFNIFEGNTSDYFLYFLSTDDDPAFNSEWKSDNVICLNHYYKIRNHNFKHYLNVANFKDSSLEYSYPCYPLINYQDKIQNNTVCVIGGGYGFNNNVINKLYSKDKIKLYIFTRKICNINISNIDINKFDIHFIEDIETKEMIKKLKQSSYVLLNYNDNHDLNTGNSCSGSLQLALSTLCKPIIINTANQYLKIENALEFDMNSNEYIVLDEEINFELLEEERSKYIDKFYKYMDEFQSTIYLRILSNEGVSNNLETWMNTDNLKYMYNKPVILTNSNNFTHAIIINDYKPKLTIPKENVIGLSHEPNQLLFNFTDNKEIFINYTKQHISHYFIGDQQDLQHPFIEGQTFLLSNKDDFYYKLKYNFCSVVISKKNQGFNYKYRHDLVKAILQTDLPIDIYGYATESEEYKKYNDCRIKHSLEWSENNPFGTIPF